MGEVHDIKAALYVNVRYVIERGDCHTEWFYLRAPFHQVPKTGDLVALHSEMVAEDFRVRRVVLVPHDQQPTRPVGGQYLGASGPYYAVYLEEEDAPQVSAPIPNREEETT